jgi:thiol-disulfide isomerase/thioredoxin
MPTRRDSGNPTNGGDVSALISQEDTPGGPSNDSDESSRTRLEPLSIAAITVVSLAVALFVTLVIVEVFGTEDDGSVDVTDALETSEPVGAGEPTTLEVGSPAPEVELELLGGGTTSIGEFRGDPLVVNFWSSTCAPCLAEMPDFESVHQEFAATVAFLGVDVIDTPDAGLEMVEQTGVTYPNGRDPRGEVMGAFGGTALPRTVLIDAEGNVAAIHSGALTATELKDLLSESGLL